MNPLLLALALLLAPAHARSMKLPPKPPPVEVAPPPVDPLATMPTPGPAVPFVPPVPETAALQNGVPVWIAPSPALPIFTLIVSTPRGSQLDAKGKEGTAALAIDVMRRGAGTRDGAAFAAEVERRGLSIDGGVGPGGASLALSGPTSQLNAGLDLLADCVLRPRLDGKEVKLARELLLAGLQQDLSEPSFVAARTAASLYWGPTHPYGRPAGGTEAGLGRVGAVDIRKWHAAAWKATGASIAVAGAVTREQVLPLLEARFGIWARGKDIDIPVPAAPVHATEPVYVVDAPDSAQTGFFVAFPGLARGAAAEAPTRLGTIALGGTFTSRLNALLREEKGYTYGVRAEMDQERAGGTLVVRTRIRADVTAEALTELNGQLDKIRAGIDAAELAKAQGAARQDVVEALESQAGVAGTLADALAFGRAPDAVAMELARYAGVVVEDVTAPMALWDRTHAVYVLVGDRKLIEPKLREQGFTELSFVVPP